MVHVTIQVIAERNGASFQVHKAQDASRTLLDLQHVS